MVDRTGILPKSPLVLTLASVRYAPWPLIAKKIDEIHDELRDVLPLLQHVQVQAVGPTGQAQPEASSIWMLMSGDRSRGVYLSQDQVLLLSKHYTRYSEFSNLTERILRALMARMRFMHVTNVGVRYVDHVQPLEGEGLEQYVHTTLLPAQFPGLNRSGSSSTAAYQSRGAELRVRCNAQPGAMSLPEEVVPTLAMMQLPSQPMSIRSLKEKEALLDIDAVEQFNEPVRMDDCQEILKKLADLHEIANAFFRREDVFTDHAFRVWKGEV